jgi:hypothetical protein
MANAGTGMEDIGAQSPFLLEEETGARSDSFKMETLPGATRPRTQIQHHAQVIEQARRRPFFFHYQQADANIL